MIRLNLKSEPTWLELLPGLRVLVAPARTGLLEAARADPAVAAMKDAPEAALAVPFTKAVARLAILEWEGVADEFGEPVSVSPEHVDALLDVHQVYVAWHEHYTSQWAELEAEKNGSALSLSGTSAGALNTAPVVGSGAPNAPKRKASRKR